jgi:hypothetical protein
MLRYSPRNFLASALLYGLVFCGLGACSIHPLPKDVTGYDTAKIVRKIRWIALSQFAETSVATIGISTSG